MDKRGLTRVTGYSLHCLLSFHMVADLRSVPASFVREDNYFSLHCVTLITAQEGRQRWFLSKYARILAFDWRLMQR